MKKLKFEHSAAVLITNGKKTTTWRLFDDKDLSVNDEVLLIDKVVTDDPKTWKPFATATINKIVEKRLSDVSDGELSDELFVSRDTMLAALHGYYGKHVSLETPVRLIWLSSIDFEHVIRNAVEPPQRKHITVYADGGSRGNPGLSASGYALFDENDTMLACRGFYLGITTNNQAEYMALKLALEEAQHLGASEVSVYMDSLLVINQMKGVFKVKNRDLWPIHDAVMQISRQFKHIIFTQVPRELNKVADAAVNRALDQQHDVPDAAALN